MRAMSIRVACRVLLAATFSTLFALPATAAPPFLLRQINSSTGGGTIAAGDVLVGNFNNSGNQQGGGTTIIQLRPSGPLALPRLREAPSAMPPCFLPAHRPD